MAPIRSCVAPRPRACIASTWTHVMLNPMIDSNGHTRLRHMFAVVSKEVNVAGNSSISSSSC
eukprot:1909596-Pyramimonas_sp.AAC.1